MVSLLHDARNEDISWNVEELTSASNNLKHKYDLTDLTVINTVL